ncbi:hypothetical protein TELCIR_09463 [Teladorsagia circumcincta]|uniref:Uncharacterized protein n=1 Tax=Teladorsagia circumcincta TaxID=45464 RepID=A0A2G9UEQ7_TELCI|nr:hypothetical protein TELCIR_09463 [Teladorsagia circumcincta]
MLALVGGLAAGVVIYHYCKNPEVLKDFYFVYAAELDISGCHVPSHGAIIDPRTKSSRERERSVGGAGYDHHSSTKRYNINEQFKTVRYGPDAEHQHTVDIDK